MAATFANHKTSLHRQQHSHCCRLPENIRACREANCKWRGLLLSLSFLLWLLSNCRDGGVAAVTQHSKSAQIFFREILFWRELYWRWLYLEILFRKVPGERRPPSTDLDCVYGLRVFGTEVRVFGFSPKSGCLQDPFSPSMVYLWHTVNLMMIW